MYLQRASKKRKALGEAWLNARDPLDQKTLGIESTSAQKKYAEWLSRDTRRRREDPGLLAQIILEEDDDSED